MGGSERLEDQKQRDEADDHAEDDEEQNYAGACGWVGRDWRVVCHAELDALVTRNVSRVD